MNDLNGWLIVVAFLAGVIFTLLWSLRRVTREVPSQESTTATDAAPSAQEKPAQEEPAEETAAAAVGAADDPEPAPAEESITPATSSSDGEDISWWDRAFVANRPAPAISPSEQESSSERSYGGTTNRDLLGPAGERIKGNRESMLYHTIASPYYGRTTAEEWFATEAAAEAAGFTRWDRRKLATAKPADAPAEAAAPVAKPRNGKSTRNGKATRGTIKGNRGSMLYHTVDSPYYGRTKAEEWFTTEADAAAAGYRRWDHKRAQRA
jgi:pyruvate/2-oxoglutarate dehydrogenase complex dihydrolipoamide acyltransferase (E2) component